MFAALATLVFLRCNHASAQEVIPADIGVVLTAAPTSNLTTGQSVDFVITVTNYGPGSASYLVLQSSAFMNQFANFVADPNECYLVTTVTDAYPRPNYNLNWEIANVLAVPGSQPFGPGETRSCHLRVTLTDQASAVTQFSFDVPSYFVDINPANDISAVFLIRAVRVVPILSETAMILLAILLIALASAAQVGTWHSK